MKLNLAFILLFIGGCASAIVFNSKEEELYHEKCSGCHRLYSRNEFSPERWREEIEDMSKKARLSADEKRMIVDYLINTQNSTKETK